MIHLLATVSWILLHAVVVVFIADFISGCVHWVEDAYFTEVTPIIGPLVIRPNILHHHYPRYFTRLSWWQSNRELLALGGGVLLICWAFGVVTWQLWLLAALGVNANEIHKWTHRTRSENGKVISTLHDWKILQTPRHHGIHHTDPKNTHYCTITNFLNPALDRVRFWSRAEFLVEALLGIKRRPDTAVRGQGPGPTWLSAYGTNSK